MYTVYMHECPNGKKYIGITMQQPEERWNNGKNYGNNCHFTQAINKYGWKNIKHIILDANVTQEEANKLEMYYIQKYGTMDREKGYNITAGGGGINGFHHSKEARAKISEAGKGKRNSPEAYEKTAQAKRIKVNVYDLQLNLLYSCKSLAEAEEKTGVDNSNISAVCKGKYKQFKGFIFKYDSEGHPLEKPRCHRKPVRQYTLDGEFIKEWGTIKEAATVLNIADTHISDCCKGKFKKSGGFIWRYA